MIPLAGGSPRKVCDDCSTFGWLSDDRRLLTLHRSEARVRLVDVDTGASVQVMDEIGRADVSPDGRWLAFSSEHGIWSARFEPGRPIKDADRFPVLRAYSSEGAAERACGWSPDSRLLYLLLDPSSPR